MTQQIFKFFAIFQIQLKCSIQSTIVHKLIDQVSCKFSGIPQEGSMLRFMNIHIKGLKTKNDKQTKQTSEGKWNVQFPCKNELLLTTKHDVSDYKIGRFFPIHLVNLEKKNFKSPILIWWI